MGGFGGFQGFWGEKWGFGGRKTVDLGFFCGDLGDFKVKNGGLGNG